MIDGLVIETSVLVDYRRNVPTAIEYVNALVDGQIAFAHPVSAAELIVGARNKIDLAELLNYLSSFRRLTVKSSDLEHCLHLVAQHRLSHGIGWPDCLIAATCIRLDLPLVTLNDKHFKPIRGLRVVRPY